MANTACWLGRGARVPAAASAGQCSCRWHNSVSLVLFMAPISSSGGVATGKVTTIVRNADNTTTRVNRLICSRRWTLSCATAADNLSARTLGA